MPEISRRLVSVSPSTPFPAERRLRFSFLEDGEITGTDKLVFIMASPASMVPISIARSSTISPQQVFQASAIDGTRLLVAINLATNATSLGKMVNISQDETIELDLLTTVDTSKTKAEVSVKVTGIPSDREVVAIERPTGLPWRVAGRGKTVNGLLSLQMASATNQVFVVALDDVGQVFTPGAAVALGDRVRPTEVFEGFVYEVTTAGDLAATEPAWWAPADEPEPVIVGTAALKAVPLQQARVHGPLQPLPNP